MKVCSKCILDENFPGIRFNEEGVCNFCSAQKSIGEHQTRMDEFESKFIELANKFRGKSGFDALVAYSGGKDSTYTLHLMKKKYGLNVLAFTFDNWFFSERAHQNIRNVVRALNIESMTVRPAYDTYKKIVNVSAKEDLYPAKAIQRSSAICTSCISLVRYLCFQTAIEKSIPFVVFGMSPGQAPISTSVVKTNAALMRKSQEIVHIPLHDRVGDQVDKFFMTEDHFKHTDNFPYSINPLAFNPYDEDKIIELIGDYGWEKPKDTDANSTNCLLNAYANKVHFERYKINPYAYEISEMVRSGKISREDGFRRLSEKMSADVIHKIEVVIEK